MVDVEQSIENIEKEIGHKLTEEQRNAAEGIGQLLNALFSSRDLKKGGDADETH